MGGEAEDRTIILTSDQKVLLISLRKERVIGSLQTLMKTVSVDCQLNFQDNNDGTYRCLSLGDSIGDFAYHPNLQEDIQETEAKFKLDTVKPTAPITEAVTAPVAEAVTGPAAEIPTKLKRVIYKKKTYYYKIKLNPDGTPLGYTLYGESDPFGLQGPLGFVIADPITKVPKGEILPPT